jgi:hypothetical protein
MPIILFNLRVALLRRGRTAEMGLPSVFCFDPKVLVDTFVQWFRPLASGLITTTDSRNNRVEGGRMAQLARETEPRIPPNPFVKADTETRETELVIAAQAGSKDAFEELQKLH